MAKRPQSTNPIDVVEASYDLDVDERTWLANLARLVRPLLDGGHGMLAYKFDTSKPPSQWYDDAAALDFDRADIPWIAEMQASAPAMTKQFHVDFDGLLGLQDLASKLGLGDVREGFPISPYFKRTGLVDVIVLQTLEPGQRGVVFASPQPVRRTFDLRTRRLWARINSHIAAGRRLRAAVAEDTAIEEVVLTPAGKVEHAEGEGISVTARTALRAAVQRTEKARGKLRRTDPERATDAWTALVSGRWSLVDRYERGGRRYIVARRNEHAVRDPRALTQRERAVAHLAALGKSNKLIGYELGLAGSTIGSHLSTVMRKLGAGSRVELIQMIHQLGMRK